ncbi:hypothetical protein EMCRGX_G014411 [Ephydatia muelleri]
MKIYETTGDVYTRQGKASAENELKSKTEYTPEQIAAILREVHLYKTFHQERPGFFDSYLNTDLTSSEECAVKGGGCGHLPLSGAPVDLCPVPRGLKI